MAKQYRLGAPAYLRMKSNPTGDPVYIPIDTVVGEETPFDFDGDPIPAMTPLTKEAETAHAEYLESIGNAVPMTVKGGAGKPFDPADPNSDSAAEKEEAKKKADADSKREADLKAREDALAKRTAELDARERDASAGKATPGFAGKAPLPDVKK